MRSKTSPGFGAGLGSEAWVGVRRMRSWGGGGGEVRKSRVGGSEKIKSGRKGKAVKRGMREEGGGKGERK